MASTKKTVRVRALEAISKKGAMTASEIQDAIGLGHGLKPTMDQEVERGHLKYAAAKEDGGATTYELTAAGRKALKDGTVDPKRTAPEAKPAKAKAKKAAPKAKAAPAK